MSSGLVPHPALEQGCRAAVVAELKQLARANGVVPGRITGIEPTGQFDGGQTSLRPAPRTLQISIQDLDDRIVRIHGSREIEVPLGPVKIVHMGPHPAERALSTG